VLAITGSTGAVGSRVSCAEVSDDVQRVSGHPARTLEEALEASASS
jgi:hypothetical protein